MINFWQAIVLALLLGRVAAECIIPGQGCGYAIPFKFKTKLGPEDDIDAMGCTIVEDRTSFEEYYTKKKAVVKFFPWTECSETCGVGTKTRNVSCVRDGEVIDNSLCFLLHTNSVTVDCIKRQCPVNGEWEEWEGPTCFDSCIVGRTQERNRACHGPFFGGLDCPAGGESEDISCPNCPAQTGTCDESHSHSFHNGFFCCKIYRSEIDPTIILGDDQGLEHCSEENTVTCPSLPNARCKVTEIELVQCPDINNPFANFEGCCATREHKTYETKCKDGAGTIVPECQSLVKQCDGFQLPMIGSESSTQWFFWTYLQDRDLNTKFVTKTKIGAWIELDLHLSCHVEAVSFYLAAQAFGYDYNIYMGTDSVDLPPTDFVSGTDSLGDFCAVIQGEPTTTLVVVSCETGPVEGRYLQMVTNSDIQIHIKELYIDILDYYGRQ